MIVTITTTSQNLANILSTSQKRQMNDAQDTSMNNLMIQNLGVYDIYIEFAGDADVSSSLRISQGETFGFSELKIEDVNFVSDGSNNSNVRIVAN